MLLTNRKTLFDQPGHVGKQDPWHTQSIWPQGWTDRRTKRLTSGQLNSLATPSTAGNGASRAGGPESTATQL
jgi:hypothetical protein